MVLRTRKLLPLLLLAGAFATLASDSFGQRGGGGSRGGGRW